MAKTSHFLSISVSHTRQERRTVTPIHNESQERKSERNTHTQNAFGIHKQNNNKSSNKITEKRNEKKEIIQKNGFTFIYLEYNSLMKRNGYSVHTILFFDWILLLLFYFLLFFHNFYSIQTLNNKRWQKRALCENFYYILLFFSQSEWCEKGIIIILIHSYHWWNWCFVWNWLESNECTTNMVNFCVFLMRDEIKFNDDQLWLSRVCSDDVIMEQHPSNKEAPIK